MVSAREGIALKGVHFLEPRYGARGKGGSELGCVVRRLGYPGFGSVGGILNGVRAWVFPPESPRTPILERGSR